MKALCVCLLLTGTASAQVLPRPPIGAGQDSNDAQTYYVYGLQQIRQYPSKAMQGFYWATRIDPDMAEGWYGLWAASILSLPDLKFIAYLGSNSPAKDSVAHLVDSLRYRADYLNPLLRHELDQLIVERIVGGEIMDTYIFGHPDIGGWLAYAQGDGRTATDRLGRAIKQYPRRLSLHWDRGRAFLLRLMYDSALVELRIYRDSIKAHQDKETWLYMEPREQANYVIGRIEEMRGHADQAKQEFEGALLEDLSYIPAHMALARLAVARNDTVDALKELEQATEVTDADRCYTYGFLLWAARQPREAAAQFSRAIAADSDFAPPYLPLAFLYQSSGDDSMAALLYRNFIARASQAYAPQVANARQHLEAIEAKKK